MIQPDLSAIPKAPFYWGWFTGSLRWLFLLVGGPVACLCAGIASAADAVLDDIRWFVNQFNPASCETEYVDRHGKARGLVRHYRESEEQWRRRVCAAYAWHKLAGRMHGMPKILDHYGYSGSVFFNRALEDAPALWAHFRIDFGGQYPINDTDYEVIRWIIAETKPAKSIMESMTLVLKPKAILQLHTAVTYGQVTTISPWVEPLRVIPAKPNYIAIGWQGWNIYTIKPKTEN